MRLPTKPNFPQPQQTLSLALSHRRGNKVQPPFQPKAACPPVKVICTGKSNSNLPPPPWGRVGERAKQLPLKPNFPHPQQTLSLTLSRRRGNKVQPSFQTV